MKPSGKGKKLRRSTKKAEYYKRQRLRTAGNKQRRAVKRRKKAEHWKAVKALQAEMPISDLLRN